ncbi:helix-turn-helix domain-containing protein [Acuticoccus sp. I52.16.1]|uniref:helix-turn-helix domain-containing protein n=1 Tax=Acuticoccus sp. I52.16.1 TaxID=2928472 RepID=UPI001FD2F574|nr:helix-turn-helix domain-containing protein [Acuticoccus sp. I52.16.1]UOM34132.1 helix-turn-helix domain-containing protein [Acuticoccus sp. I52.16.1]
MIEQILDGSLCPVEMTGRRDTFLADVGARVKLKRNKCRISRRVLSERSGVSERFLAQLEHGKGNISIVRLKAVADALDTSLAELVRDERGTIRDEPPEAPEWRAHPGAIADLYRHATARDQALVIELLVGSRRPVPA